MIFTPTSALLSRSCLSIFSWPISVDWDWTWLLKASSSCNTAHIQHMYKILTPDLINASRLTLVTYIILIVRENKVIRVQSLCPRSPSRPKTTNTLQQAVALHFLRGSSGLSHTLLHTCKHHKSSWIFMSIKVKIKRYTWRFTSLLVTRVIRTLI